MGFCDKAMLGLHLNVDFYGPEELRGPAAGFEARRACPAWSLSLEAGIPRTGEVRSARVHHAAPVHGSVKKSPPSGASLIQGRGEEKEATQSERRAPSNRRESSMPRSRVTSLLKAAALWTMAASRASSRSPPIRLIAAPVSP